MKQFHLMPVNNKVTKIESINDSKQCNIFTLIYDQVTRFNQFEEKQFLKLLSII